jgi:hypothetical protein
MPEEPPVINAERTCFDYLKKRQGVGEKIANLGRRYPRLLLSPECDDGSPAVVAFFLAAWHLPAGEAGLRRHLARNRREGRQSPATKNCQSPSGVMAVR